MAKKPRRIISDGSAEAVTQLIRMPGDSDNADGGIKSKSLLELAHRHAAQEPEPETAEPAQTNGGSRRFVVKRRVSKTNGAGKDRNAGARRISRTADSDNMWMFWVFAPLVVLVVLIVICAIVKSGGAPKQRVRYEPRVSGTPYQSKPLHHSQREHDDLWMGEYLKEHGDTEMTKERKRRMRDYYNTGKAAGQN